jgi:hypothetical protein
MGGLWRSGVVVVVLLTLTSCGLLRNDGHVEEKDDLHVLVGPEQTDEAGTGFGGTVRVVGDCVGLDLGDGSEAVVIWPHGTGMVSTNPVALDVPGLGRVEEGDGVTGGGDDYTGDDPLRGIEVPSGCRDARLVSFTPDQ